MSHVPIGALQPNPWNTNQITDPEHEEKLMASLRTLGVFKPIIVRETHSGYQIIGGEHRWRAAKKLGYKEVPIFNLGTIDTKRAKEIGLVDNARYGNDDPLGLAALLKDIGSDIQDFMPLSEIDIAGLVDNAALNIDDLDSVADKTLPNLQDVKSLPTSQVLRFKVPIDDVEWITKMIQREMKVGGFTEEDSLSNAGHAFVALLKRLEKGE